MNKNIEDQTPKLKVNFFSGSSLTDGIAMYTERLKKSLAPMGVGSSIVTPLPKHEITSPDRISTRAKYQELGKTMNGAQIAHIQHEYDYFSDYTLKLDFFNDFIREIYIPKVITIHEVPEKPIGTPKSRGPKGILRKSLNYVTRKKWLDYQNFGFANDCDVILVHTTSSKEYLLKRGVKKPIIVIPLPTPDSSVSAENLRSELNLHGKKVMLTFGQINPRKGFERVIEAISNLPEQVIYIIAGDIKNPASQNYLDELKEQLSYKNLSARVIFYGPVKESEIGRLFATADLYLAPMINITASSTLAYGLAYNLPTIATDLAATREINDEVKCLELFDGSSKDLANKINKLLTDKSEVATLKRNSKTYCRKNSQDNYSKKLLSIYEDLIK